MELKVLYYRMKESRATPHRLQIKRIYNLSSSGRCPVRKVKDMTEAIGQAYRLQTKALQVDQGQYRGWETTYQASTQVWVCTDNQVRQGASVV